MLNPFRLRFRAQTVVPSALALALAVGWASREAAHAQERAARLKSATLTVEQATMKPFLADNTPVGQVGVYLDGDTPGSTKFVTGRFVLDPGKSPHPPHTHAEEEVMIVETGKGEIFCDGKTTKVGPGSVMYTAPQAPHGIVNTGDKPLIFYFVKWVGKPAG